MKMFIIGKVTKYYPRSWHDSACVPVYTSAFYFSCYDLV